MPLTQTRFEVRKEAWYVGLVNNDSVRYTVFDLETHQMITRFKRRWAATLYALWLEGGRHSEQLDWV